MGRTSAWAYDNERPRHEVDVPAFFIDALPGDQRRDFLAFVDDGGYDDRALVERRGLGVPAGGARSSTRCSGAARATGGRGGASATWEPLRHGRARAARLLVRGGRVRALGGPEAAHRGRVGEGGGRDPDGAARRVPVGRRRPDATRANLGQRACAPPPVGAYPAGAQRVRCRAAARGRLGVDGLRLPALSGLRAVPYRGVLGGLLRQRLQGAARRLLGDAHRSRCATPSATGTTPSAGRSSPAFAARGTPERATEFGADMDVDAQVLEWRPQPRVSLDVPLRPRDAAPGARAGREARARPTPKELSPKWLLRRARLASSSTSITRLPEYYPTRREREILERARGGDRAGSAARTRWSSWAAAPREKTRLLLGRAAGGRARCGASSPST